MRKIYIYGLLLATALFSGASIASAQDAEPATEPVKVEYTVEEPNTLKDMITEEDFANATQVVVKGKICQVDVRQLKFFEQVLDFIDLSEAEVVEYYQEALDTRYEANVLAASTFDGKKTFKKILLPKGLKTIGDWCFRSCALEEVVFPEGLETIGASAFQFNKALTKVTIPATVKEMGTLAFSGCVELADLTIEEGLTAIPGDCFNGCVKLTAMNLPKSIESIADGAFKGCTGITAVVLPEGLKKAGHQVFAGLTELRSITSPATTAPDIQNDTFDETAFESVQVRIPEEAYDSYLDHFVWQLFLHFGNLDGKPLGVEAAPAAGVAVYAQDGALYVDGAQGASVTVYTLNGAAVAQCVAADGRGINLPAGAYIVSVNGAAHKVVL